MALDLMPAYAVFLVLLLVVAGRQLVRRRTPRGKGPFPDVPDASPNAEPIDAPGLNVPYSSLDPTAPTKQLGNRTRVDDTPDPR